MPSAIPKWLERFNDGVFSLNLSGLNDEFTEIIQGLGRDADSIIEDDIRAKVYETLRARQRDIEYLSSLNLHKLIAKHLRSSCRVANTEETIESWVKLDSQGTFNPVSSANIRLADEIANAIRAAWKVQTPLGKTSPKFSKRLSLGSIDDFHKGLENLIGYPPTHADFLHLMKQEHEQEPFYALKREVDPKNEWNIVMQCEKWNIRGADCKPKFPIPKRECTHPLEYYFTRAQNMFKDADAIGDALNEAEVAALRLWTGPMHEKYAEVLRTPKKRSPYVTTLHAINSGITKLAKIWPLPENRKVYRGYANLSLDDLEKDKFNCVGGVEKCVLATSEDLDIAVNYSGDGAFILEIEVGQANRGADVSWLSQFPHEREVLFNALSNVEFVRSPQQRIVHSRDEEKPMKILIYQVRISANLKSKTLDEFKGLRKNLHLNLVEVLFQEAKELISLQKSGTKHGLVKILCEECNTRCDAIHENTKKTNVCIFNDGTPEYVSLVEDAIMLKKRSLDIINLTLHWFNSGKADPSSVEGLQDWQLQALRVAFSRAIHRPEVTVDLEHPVKRFLGAESLKLGSVRREDTVCSVAKLLSLNSALEYLEMEVASELWEKVFMELCPRGPNLKVNGLYLAEYAISTLQQLDLKNLDNRMTNIIAPALACPLHTPNSLTSLNLFGSPIACAGAEHLGRAFSFLQRLKLLDLGSCRIADRGCTGIAHSLSSISELEELNLAHNVVNDEGFKILASTIRDHGLTMLKFVDMRFNMTQLPSTQCRAQYELKKIQFETPGKCMAWSPAGDQFAGMSDDKKIIIWDAKTRNQTLTLNGRTNNVTCVAWRPGGDQIVCGSSDSSITVFDAKTGHNVSTLKGHTDEVCHIAWSPSGHQFASASDDKTVIIWQVMTGGQVSKLTGHSNYVRNVAWSPGSDQVASASDDKTIIIWDVKTADQILTLKGHSSEVISISWRSGVHIASGSYDGTIIIWDAKTGGQVWTVKGHAKAVVSLAWCPGCDQIASASFDKSIIIWDATTGDQVSTLAGHSAGLITVAWTRSPRGDQIASGSARTIIIWDVRNVQSSALSGHPEMVTNVAGCSMDDNTHLSTAKCRPLCVIKNHIATKLSINAVAACVTWSPRGDKIASSSRDNMIIIWDTKSTGEVQFSVLKGHSDFVSCVAWSPGDDRIASGSRDKRLIIWDAKSGDRISTLEGHSDSVTSVTWDPRGVHIASGSLDATIIIWDAKTSNQISALKGHNMGVTSVAWSPEYNQIAAGSRDDTIIIWDVRTGDQVSMLKGHSDVVTTIAWSPRGDQVASASWDSAIIIWNVKNAEQVSTFKGHTDVVNSVTWRPEGNQIASASDDQTIIIWNANTGDQVAKLKGHTSEVMSLAWHRYDQIVSGSKDGTINIWDAKFEDQISTLKGHTAFVNSVAWRPGYDQIASGSNDNTIIIWNAATGTRIRTLKGHSGHVRTVAWSPLGDQIASGSEDETVIIWDANNGKKDLTLTGHKKKVLGLAWKPVGDKIASASKDMTIIIWDAKIGYKMWSLDYRSEVRGVTWTGDDQISSWHKNNEVIIWNAKEGAQESALLREERRLQVLGGSWRWRRRRSAKLLNSAILRRFRIRSVTHEDDDSNEDDGDDDSNEEDDEDHSDEDDDDDSSDDHQGGSVIHVAWSPKGDRIATSGSNCTTITILDAKTGGPVSTLFGHAKQVTSVDWSPGGDKIASASLDNAIIIWDVETAAQVSIHKGHSDIIQSVAWGPSGEKFVSGSRDNTIMVWDSKTSKQKHELDGHARAVAGAGCFSGGKHPFGSLGETGVMCFVESRERLVEPGSWHIVACSDEHAVGGAEEGCQPPIKKLKTH